MGFVSEFDAEVLEALAEAERPPWQDSLESPPDLAYAEASEAAAAFARSVSRAAYELRVRDAARELVAAERAEKMPAFDAGLLSEVLARPESAAHRVEGLIPAEASTLITAARKTGKTTLTLNLARCLVEGGQFLGRFAVHASEGNVALLNYEVTGRQLARWACDAGVPPERLLLVNLRGRRNPLRFSEDREALARLLTDHRVTSLIVDPFGRAFTGKSQNDAAEVGAWLVDLDQFARTDVGVSDLILTAHAGWDGERTRGSSALEDWPDVTITLTRDKDDDTVRYLAAEGRDVLVDEDRLTFDPATRMLTMSGSGSRSQAKAQRRTEALSLAVVDLVTATPGIKTGDLEEALRANGIGFQRGDVGRAARNAIETGHLRSEHGPRNAVLWFPRNLKLPSAPECSRREVVSAPDPSYKGGTTHHYSKDPVLPPSERVSDESSNNPSEEPEGPPPAQPWRCPHGYAQAHIDGGIHRCDDPGGVA